MNIEQIRKDTPYCQDKLFLNSAGSSLMPKIVAEKTIAYFREEEAIGGYRVSELKHEEISEFYSEIAQLLGCHPRNIAFAHNATDAYLKALSSIPFQKNDVIIASDDDYASNQIQFISLQKRFNIKIERIKNLKNGDLDISDFQRLVAKKKPKLVSITHVPTNSGLVQNVEAIGQICRENNLLYLVDACQSVGQLQVDVHKIQCDFMSVTGRKFLRGPRGTGFLYVSDRILNEGYEPLFVDGKGAIWIEKGEYKALETAIRFQLWEAPYAEIIGLKEAVKYVNGVGLQEIETYNAQLMERLRQNLASIPKVKTYDKGSKRCNILTFRKEGKSLEHLKQKLDENRVFYSISEKHWGLIDFNKKGIDWVVRLSPHYFNTLEEMDRVTEVIESI